MNDIREGSVDIAEQTIDLEDLDDAYQKDYDTEEVKGGEQGGGQPVGGPPMPPPAPAGPPTGGPQL